MQRNGEIMTRKVTNLNLHVRIFCLLSPANSTHWFADQLSWNALMNEDKYTISNINTLNVVTVLLHSLRCRRFMWFKTSAMEATVSGRATVRKRDCCLHVHLSAINVEPTVFLANI